jgi:hypothetical protein
LLLGYAPASVTQESGARYFVEIPAQLPPHKELANTCVCGNAFCDDAMFCRKCGAQRGTVEPDLLKVCVCGNIFKDDAIFCRKCGSQRHNLQSKSKEDKKEKAHIPCVPTPGEIAEKVVALLNRSQLIGTVVAAKAMPLQFVSLEVAWAYNLQDKDFIDVSVLAFTGNTLLQLVDYRSGDKADGPWDAPSVFDNGEQRLGSIYGTHPASLEAYPFYPDGKPAQGVEASPGEAEKLDREWSDSWMMQQEQRLRGIQEHYTNNGRGTSGSMLRSLPPCPRCCRLATPCLDPQCEDHRRLMQEAYPAGLRHMWSGVRSAVRHSGDVLDDGVACGKHAVQVDLDLLPQSISHLFFVLSAYKSEALTCFSDFSVHFLNAEFPEHRLTRCEIDISDSAQANIACYLSKASGPWVLERVSTASAGNVSNYDPIIKTIRNGIGS